MASRAYSRNRTLQNRKGSKSHYGAFVADKCPSQTPSLLMARCSIQKARDVLSHNNIVHNTFNVTNENGQCLLMEDEYFANSREADLSVVMDWFSKSPKCILWLRGAAATGKSTFLRRLIAILRQDNQLGTFYYFPRGCNLDPLVIINRLSKEMFLSHCGTPFCMSTLPSDSTLPSHFVHSVLEPLQLISPNDTSVIIIDGIDEYTQGRQLLTALSRVDYPPNIKLIFSGRPTEELMAWHKSSHAIEKITIHDLGGISDEVMEKYIAQRLRERDGWRSEDGLPTAESIRILASKAAGYIGWAAFAANLICDATEADPDETLDEVVKSLRTLDALYAKVLEPLRKRSERNQLVIGMILVIEDSLPADAIDKLTFALGLSAKEVCNRLRILQTYNGSTITPMSQNFHSSFLEYLRDAEHCDASYFPIPSTAAHWFVFRCCSVLLERHFLASTDPDMDHAVSYSFAFWPFHIFNTTQWPATSLPDDMKDMVASFISKISKPWVLLLLERFGLTTSSPPDGNNGVEQLRWLTSKGCSEEWWLRSASPSRVLRMLVAVRWIVLQITGNDDSQRGEDLHIIGCLLTQLYECTWSQSDLDQAISFLHESLNLRPPGHPLRDESLNDLGYAFHVCYEQQGIVADLDEAINLHHEALELRVPGHPSRVYSLYYLAMALQRRYIRQHNMDDLEKAVSLHREALKLCEPGNPYRDYSLNNLNAALRSRNGQHGNSENLDEAIELHRETLRLCVPGHPCRDYSLYNLAIVLHTLSTWDGKKEYFDEAVRHQREILRLHGPGHPCRDTSLNSLGFALHIRYEQQESLDDLNEAMELYREALRLRAPGHPYRDYSLHNLGHILRVRYHLKGDEKDMKEAIRLQREASRTSPTELGAV